MGPAWEFRSSMIRKKTVSWTSAKRMTPKKMSAKRTIATRSRAADRSCSNPQENRRPRCLLQHHLPAPLPRQKRNSLKNRLDQAREKQPRSSWQSARGEEGKVTRLLPPGSLRPNNRGDETCTRRAGGGAVVSQDTRTGFIDHRQRFVHTLSILLQCTMLSSKHRQTT